MSYREAIERHENGTCGCKGPRKKGRCRGNEDRLIEEFKVILNEILAKNGRGIIFIHDTKKERQRVVLRGVSHLQIIEFLVDSLIDVLAETGDVKNELVVTIKEILDKNFYDGGKND